MKMKDDLRQSVTSESDKIPRPDVCRSRRYLAQCREASVPERSEVRMSWKVESNSPSARHLVGGAVSACVNDSGGEASPTSCGAEGWIKLSNP